MGLFSFLKSDNDDPQFNEWLTLAGNISYYVGERIDFYPEYLDRYMALQNRLDEIRNNPTKQNKSQMVRVLENLKHLKLDIEAKEILQ